MPYYQGTIQDATTMNITAVSSVPMMVHLGEFSLAAGYQYLDVKTNITSSSLMMNFYSWGYLYNRRSNFSFAGAYAYTTNSLLNEYIYNLTSGASDTIMTDIYRTTNSPYSVCVKFDSRTNGYSEGKINLFFAAFGLQTLPLISSYAQNNNASPHFTS